MKMTKQQLGRIGQAALSGMTDAEVREHGFDVALGAMRGALHAASGQHKILSTAGYVQWAHPSVALNDAAALGSDGATIERHASHAEPEQRRDCGTQTDSNGQYGRNANVMK